MQTRKEKPLKIIIKDDYEGYVTMVSGEDECVGYRATKQEAIESMKENIKSSIESYRQMADDLEKIKDSLDNNEYISTERKNNFKFFDV